MIGAFSLYGVNMSEEKKFYKKKEEAPLLTGDKALPHDTAAEVAVLGSMLLAPDECIDVASKLQPKSFYNEKHRYIYKAISELNESPEKPSIDIITLGDFLRRRGELNKAGGEDYLIHLMNSMPTAANIEIYTEIVHENYILRRLIATGSDIVSKSFSQTTSVNELLDAIEQEVLEIGNTQAKNDYVVIKDLINDSVENLRNLHKQDESAMGLSTGYVDLNKMIHGLKPQAMIVIAARPSIGKTTFALNLAANVACTDEPKAVAVFSLEMSAQELTGRLLMSESQVGFNEVKNGISGGRFAKVLEAATKLKNCPIYIDDTPQIDIMEVRAKARRMKRDHDIQCIFIDYLQLMTCSYANATSREQEVAKMSGAIKAIAKELDIPVVVLAQLNRQAEQAGQTPKLSHLRESGAIEQDADIVMILHREREQQHKATEEDYDRGLKSQLIVAKHRAGETGIVNLTFFPKIMRFMNYVNIEGEDMPDAE